MRRGERGGKGEREGESQEERERDEDEAKRSEGVWKDGRDTERKMERMTGINIKGDQEKG